MIVIFDHVTIADLKDNTAVQHDARLSTVKWQNLVNFMTVSMNIMNKKYGFQ